MEENIPAAGDPGAEPPAMSFFERLTGVYFEPSKTFKDIDRRPTWLGIFVLVSLISLPFTYTLMTRMDPGAAIRQRAEASGASAEQVEQQVQVATAFLKSPIYRYGMTAVAPVGTLVVYLVFAALFLLLFIIMGAPVTFRKSLTVTFWGCAPPAMITMIIATILMYVKDPATIDPQHLVMSNLGPLVDAKAQPALNSVLSSIDLFSFWTIVLLAIGFAAISSRKLTTGKAATPIVVLWAIYVLGKMGYFAFFAG